MMPLSGSSEQLNAFKIEMKNFFVCKLCHKLPAEHNQLVSFTECCDIFCGDCISISMAKKCPTCKRGSLDRRLVSNQMLSEAFQFMCNLSGKIDHQLNQVNGNLCQLQLQTDIKVNENTDEIKSRPKSIKDKLKKLSDTITNNSTAAVEKSKIPLAKPLLETFIESAGVHEHITPHNKKVSGQLAKSFPIKRAAFVTDSKSPKHSKETRLDTARHTDEHRVEKQKKATSVSEINKWKEEDKSLEPDDMLEIMKGKTPSKSCATAGGESSLGQKTPKGQCVMATQLEKTIQSVKSVITPKSVGHKQKRNKQGETKLITACIKGDLDAVTALLAEGEDVNAQDNAKWTPLLEAAHYGFVSIVERLLDAGALINLPGGPSSDTALHDAVGNDNLEVVKLLIQRGADKTVRNSWGQIPSDLTEWEEMKNLLAESVVSKPVTPTIVATLDCHKPVVVLAENLAKTQLTLLKHLVKKYKWRLVLNYSASVTHIVTETKEELCVPSFNILCGILQGKWILDAKWLEECEKDKDSGLLQPEKFEPFGTTNFGYTRAMEQARTNAVAKYPGLFHGCHIFVKPQVSPYEVSGLQLSKADLRNLIQCGEGTQLSREPDAESIPITQSTVPYHAKVGSSLAFCSHYILYQQGKSEPKLKYNMVHIKTLPLQWFIDCVERFELMDSSKYIKK